jgi:LysM domain
MSVMSTGRAGLSAAVGAEFMAPGTWAAGSAPRVAAGSAADGCGCQEAGVNERGGAGMRRDLRITELRYRELHVREVRTSGQGARQHRTAAAGTRQARARVVSVRRPQPDGPPVSAAAQRAAARRVAAPEVAAPGVAAPGVAAQRVAAREMAERGAAVPWVGASRTTGERSAAARSAAAGRPGPVRLTRRGRAVVAGLTILAATAVALLLWLSLAGGAQASSHGQPARAGYRGMTQIVVRPGQTLWSIAAAAEPSVDPRIVIQQIIDTNALGGNTIRAGQLLWVPKG